MKKKKEASKACLLILSSGTISVSYHTLLCNYSQKKLINIYFSEQVVPLNRLSVLGGIGYSVVF